MINSINFPEPKPAQTLALHLRRGGLQICLAVVFLLSCLQIGSAATFTVDNLNDTGTGSLRQAILNANASANTGSPIAPDVINFSVAGTIIPATSLPTISEAVTIDGYSAPGAVMNTGAINAAFNGTLVVELNGASAGDGGIGLRVSAGNCVIQGLAINRFQDSGIRIDGGTGTRIFGNFIGTDLAGTASFGNFNRGILIVGSTGNFIGFTTIMSRNLISGNFGTGISITSGGSATIRRNLIGVDRSGNVILSNTQEGIRIVDSSNSVIGGSDRNVISGNNASGINVIQSGNTTAASGNVITGNYIGVNVAGTAALRNTGSGVQISAGGNTVGGTTTAARNVLSGNSANGVSLGSNFAVGNTVSGNLIGVGANGTTAIPNRDNGVQISNLAANNTIGGTMLTVNACTGSCNVIANNGDINSTGAQAGVYVDTTAANGNAVRGNSIFANTGIGIDLAAVGNTANDAGDIDAGSANNVQNKPVLSSATTSNTVIGTLNSNPNTTFAIDFFTNLATDTAQNSEGRTYLGSVNVTTDGSGLANIRFTSVTPLTVGQFITSTATATSAPTAATAIGDSSEFSNAQLVSVTTAALAGISGRIMVEGGRSLSGVTVTLTNAANGQTLTTVSNSKGVYEFSGIQIGDSYVVTPNITGYRFAPNSEFFSHNSERENLDFTAIRQIVKQKRDTKLPQIDSVKPGKF